MTLEIGSVEVPFVSQMQSVKETPETEIKALDIDASVLTRHETKVERLTIEFVLASDFHSNGLDIDTQWNNVKSLEDNDWGQNDIDFLDWKGYLSVESVEVDKEGESPGVRPGQINAFFLPDAEYTP